MQPDDLFQWFQSIQGYVGWVEGDEERIRAGGAVVLPYLQTLIDDFYEEIEKHEEARRKVTGGKEQIERLKVTLSSWLRELLAARYDEQYVARRWLVGWRHVEIGLRQVYVNAAMSRLRSGVLRLIEDHYAEGEERFAVQLAVSRALDLDLAIVQDAYESEKHVRSEAAFRSLVESADCAIFILRQDFSIRVSEPVCRRYDRLQVAGCCREAISGTADFYVAA